MDDDQWMGLRAAMDDPEWVEILRCGRSPAGVTRHDELDERISEWTVTRDDYELMHLLQSHGVPAARCWTRRESMTTRMSSIGA